MLSTWQGRDWRLVAEAPISNRCRFGALGDRTPICRRFNALGDGAPVLASDDEEPLDRTEVILGVFNFGRPPSRFARVSRGAVDGECDPPAAVPPQALASGLDNDDACLPLDRRFLGVFGRPLASRSARVRHGAMDGEGARASPSTRPPVLPPQTGVATPKVCLKTHAGVCLQIIRTIGVLSMRRRRVASAFNEGRGHASRHR